jgi:hypothetical protein
VPCKTSRRAKSPLLWCSPRARVRHGDYFIVACNFYCWNAFAVQIPVQFLFFISPGAFEHECPVGNCLLTLFFLFHEIYFYISKESCYKVHWIVSVGGTWLNVGNGHMHLLF